MDVVSLTNQLVNQEDKVAAILDKLGCERIKYNCMKNYITSTRPDCDADNPIGQITYLDTLGVYQTTRSYQGNLFTLTMDVKGVNFPKALEIVASWAGIKNIPSIKIVRPFGGFYRSIPRDTDDFEMEMKEYSDVDLPPVGGLSLKYLRDGVSLQVQEELGIRVDLEENAIITPIYDDRARLVGAKARSNDANCDPTHRFWAYLPYSKTHVLYGFHNNYKSITQKRKLVISESEKAVAQAKSMGMNICLGIGGHNISPTQAKFIKSLNADKIYIAFDEGVSEEEIEYNAKKLVVDTPILKNKVGYIYDRDNDILLKDSKDSPFDIGIDGLKYLINKKVRWLDGGKSN